jgi:glutamate carboxypeptidase
MKTSLDRFIEDHRREMVDLLKTLVLIQSGTHNKSGVDQVRQVISQLLESVGMEVNVIPQSIFGDILVAASQACDYANNILLMGHMDTVFPTETTFNWWREDEEKVYGPGVIDMKGGLVVGIYALKALAAEGVLTKIPVKFLLNSDEEVGSPVSRDIIFNESKQSVMAFVLEAAGMNGQVVTGRKGRLGIRLTVTGKAGHAAFAGPDKTSAVLALAHKIVRLEALNGQQPGLTVNVGQVGGGIGPNSVPEEAWAQVDVRFKDSKGQSIFQNHFDAIVEHVYVKNTQTDSEIVSQRPPMEASKKNRSLFRVAKRLAQEMGIFLEEEFRSGGSDANLIAEAGVPVLDGLGPAGDLDHSDREFMIKESLIQRCRLLVRLLLECRRMQEASCLFEDINEH